MDLAVPRFLRFVCCVAPAMTFGVCMASSADEHSVQQLLQSHLSVLDLKLSKTHLIHRLLQLSKRTSEFGEPTYEEIPMVTPVKNGSHEWVLILKLPSGEMAAGWEDVWVGLKRGKVLVREIPPHDGDHAESPPMVFQKEHNHWIVRSFTP